MLKEQNDLLRNVDDDGKTTVLVLLDLSPAFDTLDHKWLKLNNVRVNLSKQSMVFPRDLSLGRSFSHSIQYLLVIIISRRNVCHHLYADDMQIYITLSKSEPEMSLALLQDCLLDVGDWMRSKLRFYRLEQKYIENNL